MVHLNSISHLLIGSPRSILNTEWDSILYIDRSIAIHSWIISNLPTIFALSHHPIMSINLHSSELNCQDLLLLTRSTTTCIFISRSTLPGTTTIHRIQTTTNSDPVIQYFILSHTHRDPEIDFIYTCPPACMSTVAVGMYFWEALATSFPPSSAQAYIPQHECFFVNYSSCIGQVWAISIGNTSDCCFCWGCCPPVSIYSEWESHLFDQVAR